ncbi:hypothetical protein AYO44_09315 [Planctomycetaceae bacterium SCGC AG-212-F19]|nr:hypothetical protein AYO44_09315 [Planctomycetaceae bacterium SCGC AG-212-F19]
MGHLGACARPGENLGYVVHLRVPRLPDGTHPVASLTVVARRGQTTVRSGPCAVEQRYTASGHGYINARVARHIDEIQIAELNEFLAIGYCEHEGDWLKKTHPLPMLHFLGTRASRRKLRLFSCACCRAIGHLLPDPRSRQAIAVAERFADNMATPEEVLLAQEAATAVIPPERAATEAVIIADSPVQIGIATPSQRTHAESAAAGTLAAFDEARLARWTWDVENPVVAVMQHVWSATGGDGRTYEPEARLLRCIFGNPFRPMAIDPAWRTATVTSLAQAIYEERAFDRLPILADALEEAGADADVLGHCRGGGEHVRGCWVMDLVLGKE